MTATRVVPICLAFGAPCAEAFYAGMFDFTVDFRYAAGPEGPVYPYCPQVHLSTFGANGKPGAAVHFFVEEVGVLFRRFRASGPETRGHLD